MALSLHSLTFPFFHSYEGRNAISVPLTLTSDSARHVDLIANVDTGSTFCILSREIADHLRLSLFTGTRQRIRTAVGSFQTFGHEITISAFDLEWHAMVYFAESESISVNVVGRFGFMDRLRVAVVDYDQRLYLGFYGQE